MATDVIRVPVSIVEAGTSGNWQYTKFSDGTCDLYYSDASYSAAYNTTKGNIYTQASTIDIAYPIDVYTPRQVDITLYTDSNTYMVWAVQVRSYQTYVRFRLACNASIASNSGVLSIHVTGRWMQ